MTAVNTAGAAGQQPLMKGGFAAEYPKEAVLWAGFLSCLDITGLC